ncbi:subtilisin inhibitor 1 [Vigna unguiculata]|uniref:Proteinase inhibitor I13 n=1 Tax=Vigna unguiculata TaxID=3917 RepID=A0A4D6M580_VIGUN|nr:subtilisin inhibitor 1 [Vigna unguiculata]QCD95748.1 Proteinase inhibitor I13 [Vigna unguiculata]
MAEEKQEQGTNPSQEQPNVPLPRNYKQALETNNPTKTSWPELVGVTAEEAETKIKQEMSDAQIQVVPHDSFVTADYNPKRVRLYVDESNKVTRTPTIG